MPNLAVHDLVIQPVEKDLIIATHGRSIYKLNISALQNFDTNQKGEKYLKLAQLNTPKTGVITQSQWQKPNTPEVNFIVYSPKDQTLDFKVTEENEKGTLFNFTQTVYKGLIEVKYDLTRNINSKKKNQTEIKIAKNGKTYLEPGTYLLSTLNSNVFF